MKTRDRFIGVMLTLATVSLTAHTRRNMILHIEPYYHLTPQDNVVVSLFTFRHLVYNTIYCTYHTECIISFKVFRTRSRVSKWNH